MNIQSLLGIALAGSVAFAQPQISAVRNGADLRFNPVAVEGVATIFGVRLATGISRSPSVNYPKTLAGAEVFVCATQTTPVDKCTPAGLLYASPTQINFQVPALQPYVVVRTAGIVDQDAALGKSVALPAFAAYPFIFFMGTDCLIDPYYPLPPRIVRDTDCGLSLKASALNRADRGAVTDTLGNLITSARAARINQYYSVWLTGLGAFSNGKPLARFSFDLCGIPIYGLPNPDCITVLPTYVGMSGFPGLYQANFKMPQDIATGGAGFSDYPAWPCGEYQWELTTIVTSLAAFGFDTYPTQQLNLPVVIHRGDVPCKE